MNALPFFILGYAALGLILHRTHGHYAPTEILVFTALTLLSVWVSKGKPANPKWIGIGLVAILIFFLSRLAALPILLYSERGSELSTLVISLWVAMAVAIVLMAFLIRDLPPKLTLGALGVCGLLLLIAHVMVLPASPSPQIDVFTIGTEVADAVLKGVSPYGRAYTEIYAHRYGYEPRFNYGPGLLLAIVPARLLTGDIRSAYVVAEMVTVLLLVRIGRRLGLSTILSAVIALAWYSLPVTLFVLEQSWVDIFLVTITVLSFYLMSRGQWFGAGAALGLHVSVKQYGILWVMLSLLWIYRNGGRKAVGRAALGGLAVVALIDGPFLLFDFNNFLQNTVLDVLAQPTRYDAFTLIAYFHHKWNWTTPRWLEVLVPVSALLFSLGSLARGKARLADLVFLAFFLHSATFLFSKQAFCNYYYYVGSFLILTLLALISTNSKTKTA